MWLFVAGSGRRVARFLSASTVSLTAALVSELKPVSPNPFGHPVRVCQRYPEIQLEHSMHVRKTIVAICDLMLMVAKPAASYSGVVAQE